MLSPISKIPTVITVLGFVKPDELGITDAHSHVWIDSITGSESSDPVLNNADFILSELINYKWVGGSGQIDCQPGDCGRDGVRLADFSRKSGVNIVASTGFHRRRYYSCETKLFDISATEFSNYLMDEIRRGLTETRNLPQPVFPGQIKIAAEASLELSPLPLFEATAYASCQSNLAIQMHTEKGANVEEFLKFFLLNGVSPNRLVFSHMDKRPDLGLHMELAQAGIMLEYDTFFRPEYKPDIFVWPLIFSMVKAGLGGSIALATDLAGRQLWDSKGDIPSLANFITDVKQRLDQLVDPNFITDMMGRNIARRLAV